MMVIHFGFRKGRTLISSFLNRSLESHSPCLSDKGLISWGKSSQIAISLHNCASTCPLEKNIKADDLNFESNDPRGGRSKGRPCRPKD